MWYPLRNFLGDTVVRVLCIAVAALLAALLLLAAIFVRPQDAPTLLHYSVDFGVDYVGPWHYAWRIPLLGAVISGMNGFLAYLLFYRSRPFVYLLLAGALASLALLAVAFLLIILLNL